MNIVNLKACVKNGLNEVASREQLIKSVIVICAFGMICSTFGFFYDFLTFCCAIIVITLAIVFMILSAIITRNLNLKKRIQYNANLSLFATVIFALDCFIFLRIQQIPYSIAICCCPGLSAGLTLLYTCLNVKKHRYMMEKKGQKYHIVAFAFMGSMLGYWLMQMTSANISESLGYSIVSICLWLLSCISASGAWNFLKLYYIKIIESRGESLEI